MHILPTANPLASVFVYNLLNDPSFRMKWTVLSYNIHQPFTMHYLDFPCNTSITMFIASFRPPPLPSIQTLSLIFPLPIPLLTNTSHFRNTEQLESNIEPCIKSSVILFRLSRSCSMATSLFFRMLLVPCRSRHGRLLD